MMMMMTIKKGILVVMTTTSRFEELTKQPEARLIKIYNHGDKYDNKAHNILVSPRIVHNFDQFVDEVNEKLKPPRAPLRKIYTSQVPQYNTENSKQIFRKGTARPQSQFLHSCFCKRFKYIPGIGLTFLLKENRWTDRGNIDRSQTNKCGNGD
jgi:hypothetical protein